MNKTICNGNFKLTVPWKQEVCFKLKNWTKVKPDNKATYTERWENNDVILMFLIYLRMESNQITLIENCISSKEMLDRLGSIFNQKYD